MSHGIHRGAGRPAEPGHHPAGVRTILFVSIGYQQLNKAEPDCGTTFTWAAKAFGPHAGWLGGWGIVAADVLVMASLAQVAGQYVFLLFGADGICGDPSSTWVLLVGLAWMAVMTWICCHRGIELSAAIQRWLLSIEVVRLAVLAITALVRVYTDHGAAGISIHPAWSWFNPLNIKGDNGHFLVQPVLPGHPADAVHLLGLGLRGVGQRGDPGTGQDAGPGCGDLHH